MTPLTTAQVVHGWNFDALEAAVVAAVKSTYYQGSLDVKFEQRSDTIVVRADNWQARALSKTWVKVVLVIFLIYPFIWLYKRFACRGGGRWEVCGGAYALKTWELQPPGAPLPPPGADGRWRQTPDGRVMRLVGETEGEWFQRWESAIRDAVRRRTRVGTPIQAWVPLPVVVRNGNGYQPGYI